MKMDNQPTKQSKHVQHSGSGAGAQALMRLYPDEGVAVVLMSNAVGYAEEEAVDAAANVVFSMLDVGRE